MPLRSLHHVFSRWPNQCDHIETLLTTDHQFRETCEDYEELACWIEKHTDTVTHRIETSIQLLEELASEITEVLARENGRNT